MPPPSATTHLPPTQPAARQRPKSPNRVLAEAEAQWLFTEAELANTPSIQDGMGQAEERDLRAKGVNFVIQVGMMLKLPQLTLSTAAIFFQRFLMRASLKKERDGIPKLHQYQAAATALFLATKVEESCRKMKELILACCRVAQKNPNLIIDEQSKDWWRWRDCILHNEDVLLEVLCFDLTVESPHRQLFEMLQYYGVQHNKNVRNAAWAFVTDANNTQLCLLHNSRTIAVASLYAACRFYGIQLPDDAKGRPWWDQQNVKLRDVRHAVDYMCRNYELANGKGGANGTSATTSGSTTSADGGKGIGEIYVGLSASTPPLTSYSYDGAAEDDLQDATRLKHERQASNSPYNPPPGSERRLSNASSVGTKRGREEAQPPLLNGEEVNGINSDDKGIKRQRLNGDDVERRELSGMQTDASEDPGGTSDLKHREEALRVRRGDREAELDVRAAVEAAPVTRDDRAVAEPKDAPMADAPLPAANGDGDVSEEGELEE